MNKELKQLVIEEATKLKQHATKTQLRKLTFRTLWGFNGHNCIYGKMTGDCFSKEATRLLNLCAKPYKDSLHHDSRSPRATKFPSGDLRSVYSPIEFYICRDEAKLENLVKFLKGTHETLTVDDL